MSEFGLNLKIARLRRGLTQLQVARALGLREDVISCLETRRKTPTPELRKRLEALLGSLGDEAANDPK